MLKIKTIFFLTLLLAVGSLLNAQITETGIDSLVNYALSKFNVAGTAVGVVKDGKIIYAKGFGKLSVDSDKPVDEYTDFGIASNSKAFTTTALAILEQEGKIKWTDKVVDYIPEFRMYDPYVTENFNIADLLTHRSGLGLGMGDLMIFPDGTDFTIDDIIRNFQYFKPVSAFRTKFDYDNLLYLVAGEIVKRVSGMSWEDFITEKIFSPLKMEHTYASLEMMKDKNNLALPHANADSSLNVLENFKSMVNGAAGGIYSNVTDMGKWMIMHLNNGAYGDSLENRLISERNHYEMWKIHTVMDADKDPRYNSHFKGYGLGWGLTDVIGKMSVSHTGGLPGMLSRVIMIPDIKLGVVVLTNTSEDGAGVFLSVTNAIVDSYLGLDNYKWVDKLAAYFATRKNTADEVTEKVWKKINEEKDNPIDTASIIGVYNDNWFGKIEIYKKNGEIRFRSFRSPKLNGRVFFYNANTFAVKWDYRDMNADAFAMFTLDENGKAAGLKMKGISPNIDFSFDFQDLDLKRVE